MEFLNRYFKTGEVPSGPAAKRHDFGRMSVRRLMGMERRSAPRVKYFDLVKWGFENDPASRYRLANLRNISSTGLGFHAKDPIQLNSRIRMILNISEMQIEIPVLGEVVWSYRVGGGAYEGGVHFLEISKGDEMLLSELVLSRQNVRF